MIILFFLLIINLFFLVFPDIVLAAGRDGLLLWFNNVLPALLPFMIVTNMLIQLDFARFFGKYLTFAMQKSFNLPGIGGFVFITGTTSGYPMGAKTIADLCKKKELSVQDGQHLLAFCNNAGPLFVVGVVGVSFFGSTKAGYVLLLGHILAAIVVGMVLRKKSPKEWKSKVLDAPLSLEENVRITYSKTTTTANRFDFDATLMTNTQLTTIGKSLSDAIKNAMESMAVIGGLIIFFNVIMAVIGEISLPEEGLAAGVLSGLIEITGGARKISYVGISPLSLGLAAFVISFGGLSIHMQTIHFIEGTGIKVTPYILSKLLHGVLAGVLAIVVWMILM